MHKSFFKDSNDIRISNSFLNVHYQKKIFFFLFLKDHQCNMFYIALSKRTQLKKKSN